MAPTTKTTRATSGDAATGRRRAAPTDAASCITFSACRRPASAVAGRSGTSRGGAVVVEVVVAGDAR